jgi:inositol-1,3,4-trisphosphate 5/6-kinase / inositol-tetrakisphosphate 1-kinase
LAFITNVTSAEIRPIADCIRRAFGLELFGFDVLVTSFQNEKEREMLVVDVNYFPSYKEVPNFSQLLAQYLAQCGVEGRLRSLDDR